MKCSAAAFRDAHPSVCAACSVWNCPLLHCSGLDVAGARALQSKLASRVIVKDCFSRSVRRVAGVDVAYADNNSQAFGAAAVFNAISGDVEEVVSIEAEAEFPYIPGLLSFRELPILAAALDKLTVWPDLIICDGQGIAHPRRFGLACHLGVLYDVPTIGCAKTRLMGQAAEPGLKRGSVESLVSDGEVVGCVLRTREGVKPLYVSPGHRVSIATARDWVLRFSTRFRLPEPIRAADQTVNRMKRAAGP